MKMSANEARAYLSKEKREFAETFLDLVYQEIYNAARRDERETFIFKEYPLFYECSFYVKRDLKEHGYSVNIERYCDGFNLKIHW